MCEPISAGTALAITAGMTIATQGAQYMAQQQAANDQVAYQDRLTAARNEQIIENARLAQESQANQIKDLNRQDREATEAYHRDLMSAKGERLQADAAAKVSAGEAGVSGLSVDALLNDYARSEAVYRDVLGFNLAGQQAQNASVRKAIGNQTEGRIQSIQPYQPQPVEQPSFLGTMLRIGTGIAGDYMTFYPPSSADTPSGGGTSYPPPLSIPNYPNP